MLLIKTNIAVRYITVTWTTIIYPIFNGMLPAHSRPTSTGFLWNVNYMDISVERGTRTSIGFRTNGYLPGL